MGRTALPAAPPIVMLSQDGDVATAVRAMGNGAFDFMQRPVEDELLVERVRAALALDRERRADRALHADLRKRLERLSKREREVLEIVVAGHSNTVPAIIEALGGPKLAIDEKDYDSLPIEYYAIKDQLATRFGLLLNDDSFTGLNSNLDTGLVERTIQTLKNNKRTDKEEGKNTADSLQLALIAIRISIHIRLGK